MVFIEEAPEQETLIYSYKIRALVISRVGSRTFWDDENMLFFI